MANFPKGAAIRWAICETAVCGVAYLAMLFAYFSNSWLIVSHYTGNVELQRGMDRDCLADGGKNGSLCFDWGTIVKGRFQKPLDEVVEPSFLIYTALYGCRMVLLFSPVALFLPIYVKLRFGSKMNPFVGVLLNLAPGFFAGLINICMMVERFRRGSLVEKIPPDFRVSLGWSYFLFNCGFVFLYGIIYHRNVFLYQQKQSRRGDDLDQAADEREALPTAPPGYRS